jgi:hypothetical protein
MSAGLDFYAEACATLEFVSIRAYVAETRLLRGNLDGLARDREINYSSNGPGQPLINRSKSLKLDPDQNALRCS